MAHFRQQCDREHGMNSTYCAEPVSTLRNDTSQSYVTISAYVCYDGAGVHCTL
jgi:hypothetical protein